MSLNKISIMGRVVRPIELRHTSSGVPSAALTLAVDRDYKNKDTGERATDFIDVVAYRSVAEIAANHLSKGQMAVVEGRLQIRQWTDKDGNKRRAAEVLAEHVYFMGSKQSGNEAHGAGFHGSAPGGFTEIDRTDDDSDLPF